MTGIPPLPNVQLGNTASDIGSGTNTFIQGLIGQRQREGTLAIQKALAGANVQHLGAETGQAQAQTGDIQQQEALRAHLNEPAGPGELMMLQRTWPHITSEQLQGLTRGDVHDLVKNGMLYERLGLSQRSQYMTGGNEVYNHFIHHPDVLKGLDAKDAFNNVRGLLTANTSVGYSELFGSLARMALPNNARAVGQMLNKLSQSGMLKGPFNPQENVLLTLTRLAQTGGQLPLSPEMRQELYSTATAMLQPHMQSHDQVKKTAMEQMTQMGLPYNDSYLEAQDPFADVRNVAPRLGPAGPQAPAGPAAPGIGGYDHYLTPR